MFWAAMAAIATGWAMFAILALSGLHTALVLLLLFVHLGSVWWLTHD